MPLVIAVRGATVTKPKEPTMVWTISAEAGKLNIQTSDLDIKIARAGYLPTLSLSAGIGTSHANGNDFTFSEQVKQNWNNSLGFTVSVPIFSNRQTKSAVEKAKIQKQTSEAGTSIISNAIDNGISHL